MAIAAGEVQLTVTKKVLLGNGSALYFGTATGGAEYPTGGASVGEEPTNSRHKAPERWDYLKVDTLGLISKFVAPNKLQLLAETTVGTSTETGLSEYKSKASMATALAAVPFFGVGLA